jgi:CheY-like chemotaxis protein
MWVKLLGEILIKEGYKIRQVSSGEQALKVAEKEKPDLILLDIMMPGMDGYEVCRQLKLNQELKEIPVIFISALNDTGNIVKALTSGGVDYINKPFQEEEVKARINTHLKVSQQAKELHKLNSEKDKFLSIIAHDLRGPMSGIMQITELLAARKQRLSEDEVIEMTDNLCQSARNTFNLLENLLEWSGMERGFYDFNPESIGLQEIVSGCLDIVAGQAKEKSIELVAEIADDPNVTADKYMLQSVIRNLLSNGIKFTENGGKITISAKTVENSQVLVSVKDSGIGMTDDIRNKLFRIDANTKRPGTQGERSTGLGLLLCKDFVEKQGGILSVESEQKVGSVFSFTLPLAGASPKKNIGEIVVTDDNQKRTLKNVNILIAEDDEITAKLISIMVKGISCQDFRARTGAEAVEICLNNPDIDLVIMDIDMPVMDGIEATRQILRNNPEMIILAQTTFTMPGIREKLVKTGFTDYVSKPFNAGALVEMIQKYAGK